MGALWRSRRWRRLLDLIDQLPAASRFAEAVASDPEHMEQIVAHQEANPETRGPKGPRLSEYTLTVERLDTLIDEIRQLTAAVIVVNGGNAPKFQPQPRPGSVEVAEIKHRRRLAQHEELTRRLLGSETD